MWQRFTERARKVVFFAQQEAGARDGSYVSTEHLLLGLIREDDSAAMKMLSKFGVTRDAVKAAVEREMDTSVPTSRKTQDMQLTPRAKRVIDVSYDEARGLNHDYIGTEHLLLGLFREGEGVAAKSLRGLGLELETLRAAARELVPENTRATTIRTLMGDMTIPGGATSPLQPGDESKTSKWLRYTADARKVIFFAQEEAGLKNTNEIAPEHLFLGLLRGKQTTAYHALLFLGLVPNALHQELEQVAPHGGGRRGQDMQLDQSAKRLIDLAVEEAHALRDTTIETEHLLLGLIAEGQSPAAKLLATHGVDLERARGAVRQLRGTQEESGDSS